MELDDLRRQWQQPDPAATPALAPTQLDALRKGHTTGLVARMRRNARLEAGFNGLIGLGCLAVLPYAHDNLLRAYAGLTLVLVIILVVFYYRVLGVLGRMAEPTGSVRGHLGTLAQGLRQLLRFYYRLTLASGPATMLVVWGVMLGRMAARGQFKHWQMSVFIGVLVLLMAALTQWLVVKFARWYVQRLYGRHLDRLESQLRELNEPAM